MRGDAPMTELVAVLREALEDRYVVERELGRGGMALVLLARDRKHSRPVAIKVLSPELRSAVAAERFLREIQITAQLQHPNILPLLDSGEADGFLYSVMPYVEGESLRDRLLVEGALPVAEALFLAREAAEALDYAHRRGIIHRDVKPENLLFSNGHLIVADFGIARAIGLAGGQSLTGRGLPIGTAAYMSPEQATGDSPVDGRSDVYSLGCVLYEMLTGHMAFGGMTLKEVLSKQISGTVPDPRTLRPDVSDAVAACVERALAKDPAARYQTAGEMARALRELLGEPPRISTPAEAAPLPHPWTPGAGARPTMSGGTRWGVWLAAAAAAVLLALGVTIWWPGPPGASVTGVREASVAVLPLDSRGTSPDDAYLSEGITEEIIARLAQVPGLKVISRTSVVALKGSGLTIPRIADTLGVRHVLEGSVQRAGDRIRTRVQLIDAVTDATVWQQTYDLAEGDRFDLQTEIAQEVARALVSTVGPETMEGVRTDRPAAYDAYSRGSYWIERRTGPALRNALESFHQAVQLDSSFAPALSGLAMAHLYSVLYGFRGEQDPYTSLGEALGLAERAVAADSTYAPALIARANTRSVANQGAATNAADLRRAGALMPNSPEVQIALAHTYAAAGAYDSAVAKAGAALALDPLSVGLRHSTATLALGARRYTLALREARRGLALVPDDSVSILLRAYATLLAGRPDECADENLGLWTGAQAMCLFSVGRAARADSVARALANDLDAERYSVVFQYADLAAYHAWRGDAAGALRWLERSVAHSPVIHRWQLDSGLYDRVRNDPEFKAGLARLYTVIEDRLRARRAMLGI